GSLGGTIHGTGIFQSISKTVSAKNNKRLQPPNECIEFGNILQHKSSPGVLPFARAVSRKAIPCLRPQSHTSVSIQVCTAMGRGSDAVSNRFLTNLKYSLSPGLAVARKGW
ncbi:unnamed protein product, partial [Ectocarpus sp. 8 AP-2014]